MANGVDGLVQIWNGVIVGHGVYCARERVMGCYILRCSFFEMD
jgi:hypothetical protein